MRAKELERERERERKRESGMKMFFQYIHNGYNVDFSQHGLV
jgi:hypothetical protein